MLRNTHVINLYKVVAVVMIVYTFHAHCQGTRFAKVLNWFILMEITWNEIADLDSTWICYQTQNFMIKFEVFCPAMITNLNLAKGTFLDRLSRVLKNIFYTGCTKCVCTVRQYSWQSIILIKRFIALVTRDYYSSFSHVYLNLINFK